MSPYGIPHVTRDTMRVAKIDRDLNEINRLPAADLFTVIKADLVAEKLALGGYRIGSHRDV